MKFFKKVICSFSAWLFLLCSCIPVNSTEPANASETLSSLSGTSSAEVKAKYSAGVKSDVYAVDIEWGSMEFEYKSASFTWNPATHKYEKDTEGDGEWTCAEGANKVTVTNHSNNPVTVSLSYTAAQSYSGITGSFDVSSKTLPAPEENSEVENAPKFSATLTLEGALSESVTQSTVIGSAKVALSAGGAQEIDKTNDVGSVRLYPKRLEAPEYEYTADIYEQAENVYAAEICAEEVLDYNYNPDTEIIIDDVRYYIYKEGSGYKFMPGSEVEINTAFYPDEDGPKCKTTAIEAGKKYILTITLNGDGTGTASLEEAAAQ